MKLNIGPPERTLWPYQHETEIRNQRTSSGTVSFAAISFMK